MRVMVSTAVAASIAIALAAVPAEAQQDAYQGVLTYTDAELSVYDQTRQELAQQMVDRAMAAFAVAPAAAAAQMQDGTNPLYHDGELYVFVLDHNGTIVVHGATPGRVGTSTFDLVDTRGANIGEIFMDNRSPYGKWVEYWWPNPATETDESEIKISWVKTYGEYQFGVGMYADTPGEVDLSGVDRQTMRDVYQMVDAAAAAYAADMDSAAAAIQDPDNRLYHDGELYVFVLDGNGTIVVHGATPDLVGTNTFDLVDVRGANIGEILMESPSPYGEWLEYWWPNPATETDEQERKLTWAKIYAGHIIAVGTYPKADSEAAPTPSAKDMERQEAAWQMALNAAQAFHADPASAMAAIQDPDNRLYHDGEMSASVLDYNGTILAHGATPDLVGANIHDIEDARGANLGAIFEQHSPYGKWVEYWWHNPATENSEGERKMALLLDRGGYVFSSSTYPGDQGDDADAAESEKRRIAKAMVEAAIEAYANDHAAANKAIADLDNPLYHDGELYVFVLDYNGTMAAHGVTPDLVGTSMFDLVDAQGTNLGDLFMESPSAYGEWLEYWWPNPATETDEPERKLTWAKASSSYIFAVGVYP